MDKKEKDQKKVIKLVERTNDNRFITTKDMLEMLLAHEEDISRAKRCLVLLLDDEDGQYDTCEWAANLTDSEMISLCMDCIRKTQDRMRGIF